MSMRALSSNNTLFQFNKKKDGIQKYL